MTGTAILNALFGAGLVALGVIAAALADRIRGIRISRDVPEPRPSRAQSAPAARSGIPVVETAELLRPATTKPRAPRGEPKSTSAEGGDDVIAALVASGYKKLVASEAAWSCSAAERATIEGWVASALRRCARGAS